MLELGADQWARMKQLEAHHLGAELKIGSLRHRVDIEEPEVTVGDRGQGVATWSALYEGVPASVETLAGREAEQSRQLVATADYKVTMRYHSGIEVGHRVIFGEQRLEIGHINDQDQRHLWLVLTCSEVKE